MLFYILIVLVAASLTAAISVNIKYRESAATIVGNSSATLLIASLAGFLIFTLTATFVGMSNNPTKVHVNTETYPVAQNSRIDSTGGKLNFMYLKDGHLENYSNSVSEIRITSSDFKTVDVDIVDEYYPGWSPFVYNTTRSATIR